jgi:oligoribonuclease NrnB/cAMP/cGMP phosphodiesterase (DHH superfamily)
MSDKPIVIYHKNCRDGFAAAWCFWTHFGNNYEYHAASYGTEPPDTYGRNVFLVDFCYGADVMDKMCMQARITETQIVVLDHHKSSLEMLAEFIIPRYPQHVINTEFCTQEKSGAGIAWDFVSIGEPRPATIDYIEDRDLWKFVYAATRPFNAALDLYPFDFEIYENIMYQENQLIEMINEGETILKSNHKLMKELIRTSRRLMWIGGYPVWTINCPPMLASEACEIVYREDKHKFVASYFDTQDFRLFSLRSNASDPDSVDVAAIANMYGGGGHKHASGFRVSREHMLARL